MTASSEASADRVVRHGGRPNESRMEISPAQITRLHGMLEPDRTVADGLAALLEGAGCAGGMMELTGGLLDPIRFVLPANSADPRYAVYFSETHAPEGGARVERAWCSLGWKDGERFMHCHGLWRTSDGRLLMGHLLGADTRVKEAVTVRGFGTTATFIVTPDEETNFSLFAATPSNLAARGAPAALLRLRPNADLIEAAEQAIERIGLKSGTLYGIGSVIDLRFEGGEALLSEAIEIMITDGRFSQGTEGTRVDHLEVAGVGIDGSIKSGRLERGRNRVCVTAELLIVGDPE